MRDSADFGVLGTKPQNALSHRHVRAPAHCIDRVVKTPRR